jgi:hypothetical protein
MKPITGFLGQWAKDLLGAGIVLVLFFLVLSILIILFAPLLGPSLPLI